MPEVENLSDSDAPDSNVETVDIKLALVQQLESLRWAGLTHLPTGTGKYEVEFGDLSAETTASMPLTTKPANQPAQVKEAPASPGVRNHPGEITQPAAPSQPTPSESPALSVASPAAVDPVPSTVPVPPTTSGPITSRPPATSSIEANETPYGASLPLAERTTALNVLREEISGCTRCDELSSKRTQTVFGVGNPAARLVFVGEGPGQHEDRLGEPFVGEAGEQLDKIIKACKLSREEVFILNAVKCRPPQNRNPSQNELSNCWGYAERQLEILQPEFIVCLGSVAARTLLNTTQSLGRLRKQFHSYRNSRVLVTYHPAYLLRTPSAKRHVWEDMKMLMKEMGIDWTK